MFKKGRREAVAVVIVFLFIATSVIPSITGEGSTDIEISKSIEKGDILDQYQDVFDPNSAYSIYDDYIYAQSFKPSISSLSKVELAVLCFETDGALHVTIRSSLDGPILTECSVMGSSMEWGFPCRWHEFDFPDITVTPEQTYFIQVNGQITRPGGGFGWSDPPWDPDDTTDYYTRGMVYTKRPDHWVTRDDDDFAFRTYGDDGAENQPPVADAGFPYRGTIEQSIVFDGSGSYDPDGDIVGYRWDFENDGNYDTGWSSSETASHNYGSVGQYTVKLEVKDNVGETDTDTESVYITENNPPNVPGIWSVPEEPVYVGNEYRFTITVSDPDGDDVYLKILRSSMADFDWIGPLQSGSSFTLQQTWETIGSQYVIFYLKDEHELLGDPLELYYDVQIHGDCYFKDDFNINSGSADDGDASVSHGDIYLTNTPDNSGFFNSIGTTGISIVPTKTGRVKMTFSGSYDFSIYKSLLTSVDIDIDARGSFLAFFSGSKVLDYTRGQRDDNVNSPVTGDDTFRVSFTGMVIKSIPISLTLKTKLHAHIPYSVAIVAPFIGAFLGIEIPDYRFVDAQSDVSLDCICIEYV